MPKRIQRRRERGWRMPEGAVYVGRPTRWGNPFQAYKCDCCGYWDVRDDNDVSYLVNHAYVRQPHIRADRMTWTTRYEAVIKAVRLYADEATCWLGGWQVTRPDLYAALPSLAGRDLACWCPLEDAEGRPVPCHADVLLALANGGEDS